MSTALESALRLLARRDHSRRELEVKLASRGFSAGEVQRALVRLNELGYLDDARAAATLAEHLTARGYGVLRVRYALGQKGIEVAIIENALLRCGDDDAQVRNANRALGKKQSHLARESDPMKRRQRAYRFLAGRGFSAMVIRQVIGDYDDDFS